MPARSGDGLLLVAHGSRDPRSAPVAREVAAYLSARLPTLTARACFLELCEPDPPTALDELVAAGVDSVTVVPFLLSHAYHASIDVPGVLAAARERFTDVRHAAVLGPDPLLLEAVDVRLAESNATFDWLVVAAAGSSRPDANAAVRDVAEQLGARHGVRTSTAYASAAEPTVGDAVAEARRSGASRVAVATYLLAPGFFGDRIAEAARSAGAVAVTEALGAAEPIVDLVARRHLEAGSTPASPTTR